MPIALRCAKSPPHRLVAGNVEDLLGCVCVQPSEAGERPGGCAHPGEASRPGCYRTHIWDTSMKIAGLNWKFPTRALVTKWSSDPAIGMMAAFFTM